MEHFEAVDGSIDAMKSQVLYAEEERAFATAALALRHGERTEGQPAAPIAAEQLLELRRPEDVGHTTWAVFQRVQENMLRGGQTGRTAQGRRLQTRAVGSIDRSVNLNRAPSSCCNSGPAWTDPISSTWHRRCGTSRAGSRWSPARRRSPGSTRAFRARPRSRTERKTGMHVRRSQKRRRLYRSSPRMRSSWRHADACVGYTLGRRDGAGILRAGGCRGVGIGCEVMGWTRRMHALENC